MRKYQSGITDLRNELIGSIKTILRNNDLNEIPVGDVCDKTYVVWWSNKGDIYEGEVLLVKLNDDELSILVDTDDFPSGIENYHIMENSIRNALEQRRRVQE